MKIAIDIREAVKGRRAGKGWYTFQLIQAILSQDEKNEYLLYTNQPFPQWIQFKNATQRFFPPRSMMWHYNVMRDIKKQKPDIFFAPTSYIIAAFAPREVKTIITIHDLIAWYFPDRHNKKATLIEHCTLPAALKKVFHIIAVSSNTKNDIQKLFHVSEKRISIIGCAAGSAFRKMAKEETEALRKDKNLPEKFILSVGTLEPRKNYITLLKSFQKLKKNHPDLNLVIIGGKGWYYKEIFRTVGKLQLQDSVYFPGYVSEEDLVKYYNLAEVFVYPSLYEGFGIPVLEAMQSGCPVITGNNSSLPEVAGKAALFVDAKNPDEIAEKMDLFLTDEKLRNEYIEKGFEQARKFSWQKEAARMIELFSSLNS